MVKRQANVVLCYPLKQKLGEYMCDVKRRLLNRRLELNFG